MIGSVFCWAMGVLCAFAAMSAGEVAGEALYRPGRFRIGVGWARVLSVAFALLAAVFWRFA